MKRVAALFFLFLSLPILVVSVAEAGPVFPDVVDWWAEESISLLTARGLILGYEDGLFRPERNVSRAEAAKVIVSLLGWEEEARAVGQSWMASRYGDVRSNHWALGYIEVASDLGLFIGDDVGWFRPEAWITRAELMTVLGRTLTSLGDASTTDLHFPDVDDIPLWAVTSLRRVIDTGMLSELDQPFHPGETLDRSMFVDYIRKYMRYCGCDFDLIGEVTEYGDGVMAVALKQATVPIDLADLVCFRNGKRGLPRPYDQVGIVFDDVGNPLHVSSYFMAVQGVLVSRTGNRVSIRDDNDVLREFTVSTNAVVFRQSERTVLSALSLGDEVLLVLDYRDGSVRAVDALRLDGSGRVESVSAQGRIIIVRNEYTVTLLMLDEQTRLYVDGLSAALEDIKPGMMIRYAEGELYTVYAELSSPAGGE